MRHRMRIALGLTDDLKGFARRHSAQGWRQFSKDDPVNWRARRLELMISEDVEIFFNLDGVDVWKGVTRASAGGMGGTDWELLQIFENTAWWPRLTWWKGGQEVANPFLGGEADAVLD